MESKYPRRDYSFNISNRFLRSVARSIFIHWLIVISPLAIWIVDSTISTQTQLISWGNTLNITGLVISMLVNALVTGLIVFRIFKVFWEVKAISHRGVLTVLCVTDWTKIRSVIFIMIESGVALFSIQLARLVLTIVSTDAATDAILLIMGIHQMLNVTILLLPFIPFLLITWTWLGYNTYHHHGAGVNGTVFLWRYIYGRNCAGCFALWAWWS